MLTIAITLILLHIYAASCFTRQTPSMWLIYSGLRFGGVALALLSSFTHEFPKFLGRQADFGMAVASLMTLITVVGTHHSRKQSVGLTGIKS